MAMAYKVTRRCTGWRAPAFRYGVTTYAFDGGYPRRTSQHESRPFHLLTTPPRTSQRTLSSFLSPLQRRVAVNPVAHPSPTPQEHYSVPSSHPAFQTQHTRFFSFRHRLRTPISSPPQPSDPEPPTKPASILQKLSPSSLTPHENIYTIPNILTFTRLLSAPLIGYFILTHSPVSALLTFFYAGITDLLDGFLARYLNQPTVVGSVIDPMADKLLMSVCVLALGYIGSFPWWLVVIIFGRDFALAISAIWWRWISLPPPKTMLRYWDFSLPSAEVHPTEISKINTLLQLCLVGSAMTVPVLPLAVVEVGNLQGVLEGWEFLVASTTVWSGLSYIGNKDAVKVLNQEQKKEGLEGGQEHEVKKKGEER